MRRPLPPADQVRDALERVVSSEVFARSERARDLLSYLVDRDLAGESDRLKGFAIAVDVFGRGEEFDPATDTVVRVQAGRLRDLLDQYYSGQGASDPLRIIVPRGSYIPEYREGEAAPETAQAIPESAEPSVAPPAQPSAASAASRRPSMLASAAAALLVAATVVAGVMFLGQVEQVIEPAAAVVPAKQPTNADVTASVPGNFLPRVYLDIASNGSAASDHIATTMRRGLAMFDTVQFLARPPDGSEPAQSRRTDFVFRIEDGSKPGEVHLELQNVASGKVLLSRNLTTENKSPTQIEDDVADILTTIAPVSGVIHSSLIESGEQTLMTLCLFLNERFYRDQQSTLHREAYECLEGLIAANIKSALIYSELAGLHFHAVVNRYKYPAEASHQKALDYARMAVQLAPGSAYAHRATGYVLSRTATQDESLRWLKKAYELNTFDLGVAASYGYALIFAGDYENGTPIMHRAVTAASAHPTWWDYGLFLGNLMLDDRAGAANAVSALSASKRAHYVAARLIAAHGLGAEDRAKALLAELVSDHKRFSSDPEGFFRRGNYPGDLIERLMQELRAAGLSSAS